MTFDDIRADVRLALGNMKTSSVWVTSGALDRWINDAQQRIPLFATGGNKADMNLFPELETSFHADGDEIVVGRNYVDLPTTLLAGRKVHRFEKLNANPQLDRTWEVSTDLTYDEILSMGKDLETVGWPRLGAWRGRRLYYWPTTSADYVGDLLINSLKRPTTLVDAADVPTLGEQWHQLIVTEASSIGALRMRWFDDSKAWHAAVLEQLGGTADTKAMSQALDDHAIEVDGLDDWAGYW